VNVYYVMAIWVGMALIASFFSIKVGISVALIEILVGAIAGNIPGIREHVQQTDYTTLLAGIGSVLLTFLAGAEIDPVSLKNIGRPVSPWAWCRSFCPHWCVLLRPIRVSLELSRVRDRRHRSQHNFGGSGLRRHGRNRPQSSGHRQADPRRVLRHGLGYGSGSGRTLRELRLATPRVRPRDSRGPVLLAEDPSLGRRERRSSRQRAGGESDIRRSPRARRTGDGGGSEAVLPAYVAGLVVAGVFMNDRVVLDRIRTIAFALLTPFFFLRAGTLISDSALVTGAGVIVTLFFVKMVTKFLGVWPTAKAFKLPKKERTYTTLLMATGLTFGSISALYGLTHHLINEAQYTELVTVVILSAFVPTLIAQQFFRPTVEVADETVEALGEEDISLRHRRLDRPGAARQRRSRLRIQRDSRAGATSGDKETSEQRHGRHHDPNFCERPHRGGCPFSSSHLEPQQG